MTRFRCPSGSLARAKTGSMQNVTAHAKSAAKERVKGKGRAVPRLETIEENEAGGSDTHHTEPAPEPGPSRGAKKPKGKSKARATVKSNTSRREAEIRTQIKKSMVQVHSNRGQWSFVFVGNLSSATENKDLRRHFASCGQISDIQIRASGGVCVPTAKLPTPYWGMGTPYESVHYATIRFKTPEGARNAMGMSGTVVMGKRIIVTVNAIELPETVNIVGEHLKKKTAPPDDTKRSFWQGKYGQLKRLTIEKTEPCISEGPATGPGAALLVAGLGKRVGASTAGGSTAAGDQNRHAPRWPLLLGSFPKTLA